MPLGAPNNDRVGVDRPGNNLFSSSIVAVNADTGQYLWHFQVTHHDIWDNDTQDPSVQMDVHKDGKTIPALLTVNKNALASSSTVSPASRSSMSRNVSVPQSQCAGRGDIAHPAFPGQASSSRPKARSASRQPLKQG